jgi:2-dehydro-3-deoxy-D-gluconate 5-dehydrogenase
MAERTQGASVLTDGLAVVTGGVTGIGRSIAEHFLATGADVTVVDRDPDGAAKLEGIVKPGNYLCADLADSEALATVLPAAADRMGGLNILVNNAAVITSRSLADTTVPYLDEVYATNFRAPLMLCRSFAELADGAGGQIINIASAGGIRAVRNGSSAYGSMKAALISATAYLARELGPAGIRVNAIAPGSIATGHSAGRSPEAAAASAAARAAIVERTAVGRLGIPADIATVAVFLASPAAAYIAGQTILVDGGWLLG